MSIYLSQIFSHLHNSFEKRLFQKKSTKSVCVCVWGRGGGVEEKLSCNFYIFHFTPLKEIPEKTSFHHWKFCKIVWHPLDLDPHRNSAWVFLIPLFFKLTPLAEGIYSHTFSSVVSEITCPSADLPTLQSLKPGEFSKKTLKNLEI